MITNEAEQSVRQAIRHFATLRGRFELIFLAQSRSPWPELLPQPTWEKWILEELEALDQRLTNEYTKPKHPRRKPNRNPKTGRYQITRDDRIQSGPDRGRGEGSPFQSAAEAAEYPLDAPLSSDDLANATRRCNPTAYRNGSISPSRRRAKRRRSGAGRARRRTKTKIES